MLDKPFRYLRLVLAAMGQRRKAVAFLIAWLGGQAAWAQANGAWTLDHLMRAALDTHPAIVGSRADQAAAAALREGARWQRFPSPSLETDVIRNQGNASDLRVDQPLWAGGRITAGIEAAESRYGAASAAVDETGQSLLLAVAGAAVEAVRQQARQSHAQASLTEHARLLEMIKRRVKQEVSPPADQKLAEARLYSATNDLSTMDEAYRDALVQLSQLAGERVEAVAATGALADNPSGDISGSFEQVIEQALAQSPTLKRLELQAAAAEADIQVGRAAYSPQLSLRLENIRSPYAADNRALLVLQYQPGAGLSAAANVDAAIARRDSARQAREAAERDLRQQIGQDWNGWVAARQRVDNAELVRTNSIAVAESYARQYVAGRTSWLDVLNATLSRAQAEYALDDARAQKQLALLRLKIRLGLLHPAG